MSRVGLTAQDGRGPAQDPGWRESVIQRGRHRQKRWRARGTGAVMATGSYEGSPVDRRHLGSSRGVSVTRSVHGWSSALRRILRPGYQGQKPRARRRCSPRESEGGGGWKTSERDRGVRGSIASAPWDENAHAHDQAVRHPSWGYVLHRDPPKRSPGVVKRSIPLVMPFGA